MVIRGPGWAAEVSGSAEDVAKVLETLTNRVSMEQSYGKFPAKMKVKILFLAANPAGSVPRALDEEMREITQKIRDGEHRDLIEVVQAWAARPDDLQQALLQHKPHIVHFSGYGTETHELILLDQNRNPKPVSKAALAALFKVLKDNVQVVVLNACYSQPQAEAITQHVPCAIGMTKAIGHQTATTFAASFYRAIAYGRSVQDAFDLGISSLLMEGIPDEHTPQLVLGANVNASELRPINPPVALPSDQPQADGQVRTADTSGTAATSKLPAQIENFAKKEADAYELVSRATQALYNLFGDLLRNRWDTAKAEQTLADARMASAYMIWLPDEYETAWWAFYEEASDICHQATKVSEAVDGLSFSGLWAKRRGEVDRRFIELRDIQKRLTSL